MVIIGILLVAAAALSAPVALFYGVASVMESDDTTSNFGPRELRAPAR